MAQRTLTVAAWITATNGFHLKDEAREIARLGDGGWLSIQASRYHRCQPKMDNAHHYQSVEIGSRGVLEGSPELAQRLEKFRRTVGSSIVYAEVPVEIADDYVAARGGIVV